MIFGSRRIITTAAALAASIPGPANHETGKCVASRGTGRSFSKALTLGIFGLRGQDKSLRVPTSAYRPSFLTLILVGSSV